jgi:hypothetical protein
MDRRRWMMQFRWVVFIALWTTLVGPILGAPSKAARSRTRPAAVMTPNTVQPAPR